MTIKKLPVSPSSVAAPAVLEVSEPDLIEKEKYGDPRDPSAATLLDGHLPVPFYVIAAAALLG